MIYQSHCIPGPTVTFPIWQGERHYMIPFTKAGGLPKYLSRFEELTLQMLSAGIIDDQQECYLMIDESEVREGQAHRRPGVHVDGYWNPAFCGHDTSGHRGRPAKHTPYVPTHSPTPMHHGPIPTKRLSSEAILLASNYAACRAYEGPYEKDFEQVWAGGDCSSLDVTRMQSQELQANRVYALDVFSLHESLPIRQSVKRTVARINAPGFVAHA